MYARYLAAVHGNVVTVDFGDVMRYDQRRRPMYVMLDGYSACRFIAFVISGLIVDVLKCSYSHCSKMHGQQQQLTTEKQRAGTTISEWGAPRS